VQPSLQLGPSIHKCKALHALPRSRVVMGQGQHMHGSGKVGEGRLSLGTDAVSNPAPS
jgi:hypothetical protein